VYQPAGKNWFRMSAATARARADGRSDLAWTIPYPSPTVEVAFCYPYGMDELDTLVRKSGGFWTSEEIGLTQEGRAIVRLASDHGAAGSAVPGFYIVARQHAGETPASWVLDGLMDRLSRDSTRTCSVWVVPMMDADGAARGAFGRDRYPRDMNCSWGSSPMRHETLVVQEDVRLWASRCRPAAVFDMHAQCEDSDGVIARLVPSEENPALGRETVAWANLIADHLGREFASGAFVRAGRAPHRWDGGCLCDFASGRMGIPSLSLETPYAFCGGSELTQKQYREIGRRIGKAVLIRVGQAAK
jgi:murein tripeptide amidase MpaA